MAVVQAVAWIIQSVMARKSRTSPQSSNAVGGTTSERKYFGETTRANFRYIHRRTRYQVNCPVRYQVEGKTENGTIVDMAREGWRVKGSGHVSVGTVMSLTISLPGGTAPVKISRAMVHWSQGDEFGISLVDLDSGSAVKLSEFFRAHTSVSQADLSAA
jgi:hypothetical protein